MSIIINVHISKQVLPVKAITMSYHVYLYIFLALQSPKIVARENP